MRILLSEDQPKLLSILKERLTIEGYAVDATPNGEEAIKYLESATYDLVVLDIMMPILSGLEVLVWMRKNQIHTPVIMLTAKDSIDDKIKGLDLGADDYLIKPFSYDELLARIRALLRRQSKVIHELLEVDGLTLNRTTNEVHRNKDLIKLSKKEYALLEYLMIHKGEVVSRDQLERISSSFDYEGYSNVIDVYISFLRKKVDGKYDKKLIQTIRGFGYTIKEK